MAFTGTATILQISDRLVRITGLSLAAGASGTIALTGHSGATPDVVLPATFNPQNYTYGANTVHLADAVQVTANPAAVVADFEQVGVAKTGTTDADFRATLSNGFTIATPALEIYVRYHE